MADWPDVTVMVITYNRPEEIRRTVRALQTFLKYDGHLKWLLADDGSPGTYIADVQRDFTPLNFGYCVTSRGGWGKNVNRALATVSGDYVFMIEDDYVAEKPLNLSWGVALMEAESGIGLVRYDGIAGHSLDLHLRVAKTRMGDISYASIDHASPHLNVYSNRPQLKHRRFHAHYGPYPEGHRLGETEEWFSHRVKDLNQGPKLAILANGIESAFVHIGHSWQGSAEDK